MYESLTVNDELSMAVMVAALNLYETQLSEHLSVQPDNAPEFVDPVLLYNTLEDFRLQLNLINKGDTQL